MPLKLRRRDFLAAAVLVAVTPTRAAGLTDELTEEEFDLLRQVNLMRRARGLKLLTLRRDLCGAARAYARRMATEKFFSHVAPGGDGPTDRADAAGYDWRRLGETLAAGYATPAAAARSWRESAGHAKIIFDPNHRHAGVGYWRQPSRDPNAPELERYWVLLAGDTR